MNDPRNIVTTIEGDGAFIDAQFVREDGEVVIGVFKCIGWSRAPKDVRDDVNERPRLPPLTIVETKRR